jgi:hypothetical protein
MSKYYAVLCNGLHEELFGSPLSMLGDFLNEHTPTGIHFEVIGGMDPRVMYQTLLHNLTAAISSGYRGLIVGHSLGAMWAYYAADELKRRQMRAPLCVAIDPTDWGSNINCNPYVVSPPEPGHYLCPDSIDRMIHIRQPFYPGGGFGAVADGNKLTAFTMLNRTESHVVLPLVPAVQQAILGAVLAVRS